MFNSIKFIYLIFIFFVFQIPSFAQTKPSVEKESAVQKETIKIKKLSQEADMILTGKVTQKKSDWNASKTRIYTRTTLQVEEYLKGEQKGTSVEITSPGGEVGEVGELYTHMPTFENEEEVLVFLKKDESSQSYKVLNGEEGKIKVHLEAGKDKKEKAASSDLPVNDLKSQIRRFVNEP